MWQSFGWTTACMALGWLVAGCGPLGDLPADPEAQVAVANPAIAKELLLEDARLGTVSDIRVFPDAPEDRFVGVAGENGVLFLNNAGEPKTFQPLGQRSGEVRFAATGPAGFGAIIGVDTWQGATVYDPEGKVIWQVKNSMGVNSVAACDFSGDGELQYAIGYNGWGGIRLFDNTGKELWKQSDGNVWHVECLPAAGDSKATIVHSNAGGEMTFRDASGAAIKTRNPKGYFSSFSLCPWPDAAGELHLMDAHENTIRIYDREGDVVKMFNAPLSGDLGDAQGTPVRLEADAPTHFAVAVKLRERTVLYIYDHEEKLVYHEVLSEAAAGIAAVPNDDGNTDSLYVGGTSKVWKFTLSPTAVATE